MKDSALKIAKGYYMDGGEESLATPHKGQMQEAILPPSPTTHVPPQACVFDFWNLPVQAFPMSSPLPSATLVMRGSIRYISCLWGQRQGTCHLLPCCVHNLTCHLFLYLVQTGFSLGRFHYPPMVKAQWPPFAPILLDLWTESILEWESKHGHSNFSLG